MMSKKKKKTKKKTTGYGNQLNTDPSAMTGSRQFSFSQAGGTMIKMTTATDFIEMATQEIQITKRKTKKCKK